MSAVMIRNPLNPLNMPQTQRTSLRRSARHAFEDDEIPFPAAKRTKNEGAKENEVEGGSKAANGAKKGSESAATKKGKGAAYDEDDNGFQFSRTRSKKSKTPAPPSDPAPAAVEKKAPPAKRKRTSTQASAAVEKQDEGKARRSKRLSGDRPATPPKEKPKARQQPNGVPKPVPDQPKEKASKLPAAPSEQQAKAGAETERDGSPMVVDEPLTVSKNRADSGTKIALPFADTPVIKRNKEMRKQAQNGPRRSSTGMRGRRASSLIESGSSNAVPHSDVDSQEFYKLIDQAILEPRRMKQLLTWCGTRALPPKSGEKSKDADQVVAIETARHIQEELLKDFAGKPELSDWFSREDEALTTVLVKKPNPRNVQNAAKLQELEQELQRLQDEKKAWDDLLSTPSLPPPLDSEPNASIFDARLLDSSQAAFLSLIPAPVPATSLRPPKRGTPAEALHPREQTQHDEIETRLRSLAQNLEPSIDIFADGVHKLGQYRLAAERVADRVLADGAKVLEKRDRKVREASGTAGVGALDALRALGGVMKANGR